MKKILLLTLLITSYLFSDITDSFPTLDSRVMDEYKLLSTKTKNKLENTLKKHENETSNQIVVLILNSLDGNSIEEYGYQIGRHWGIGQKEKNNGVILLISMKEKKIRIEVGYGLEGALTDKISHEIIEYTIKPKFRINQFEKGILLAIDEIILAIKGEYTNKTNSNKSSNNEFIPILFFALIFISMLLNGFSKKIKNIFIYKTSKSTMLASFSAFFTYAMSQEFIQYNLFAALVIFLIVFIFNFLNTKKIDFSKVNRRHRNSYGSTGGFGGGFGSSSSGGFSGGGGSFGGGGGSGGW